MFYGLHTTKNQERRMLLEQDGPLIEIDPISLYSHPLYKSIIWEEDYNRYYEYPSEEHLESFRQIINGKDPSSTKLFRRFEYKGDTINRLYRLEELSNDIKKRGILNPIDVTITGERLDGSFRAAIAVALGIDKIKARLHKFTWQNIDEDFIERKLKSKELSCRPDYYSFKYGYKDWENNPGAKGIFRENAEKCDYIKELVEGDTVVDIGCNEGYLASQLALDGKKVWGCDVNCIHNANFVKLVYEWINKKDLDITYEWGDATELKIPTADTVLLLNIIYHLPREKQVEFLSQFRGSQLIFQCNLDKSAERKVYYGSHPEDLKKLAKQAGFNVIKEIDYKRKPIIICH